MQLAWVSSPLFLVYALATFRITRLWLTDSLPPLPHVRTRLRMWLGKRRARALHTETQASKRTAMELAREHHLVKLLTCAWCVGFWVSAVAVIVASTPAEPYLRPVAVVLAFSAVVGLLSGRDEN